MEEPDSLMQRIALCGGTFDPFHRAHLEVPLSIASLMGWSEILYIPAYRQPFKLGKKTSPSFHRHAMVVLATLEEPRANVALIELGREETSYTIDTLQTLRKERPDAVLDWIIGDDNLETLSKWRSIDQIFELANFVVLQRREGTDLPPELESRRQSPQSRPSAGAILFVQNPTIAISSTDIRARVARGESIEGLVHPRVAHYIEKNRLYTEAEH